MCLHRVQISHLINLVKSSLGITNVCVHCFFFCSCGLSPDGIYFPTIYTWWRGLVLISVHQTEMYTISHVLNKLCKSAPVSLCVMERNMIKMRLFKHMTSVVRPQVCQWGRLCGLPLQNWWCLLGSLHNRNWVRTGRVNVKRPVLIFVISQHV